ncbi:arsenate reductase family protein [Tannockella kyphosi]|uniref:arsenate reductase family protein n=1 Tax=Tannockella kyphosi TaxID=2899121 RepID=UPI002012E694|nr:arsenate reductase family protein [Tannockella kyphosi]
MKTFILYPKCSTCIKARKHLEEKGIDFTQRHIVEEAFNFDELLEIYKMSGYPLKKFFNTSGIKYRELGLKDKLPLMSEEEQLHLLASDGMLVKRPILIDGSSILIGYKKEEYNNL